MRGGEKPTREDILAYFRAAADFRKLEILFYRSVIEVQKNKDSFSVRTQDLHGSSEEMFTGKKILLATGVWENNKSVVMPGIMSRNVEWDFTEPTKYYGCSVAVVGGGNSAAGAAMSIAEAHGRPTLIMRQSMPNKIMKLRPFVFRDLEFAVKEKKVKLLENHLVTSIEPKGVWAERIVSPTPLFEDLMKEKPLFIPSDFVLFLIGKRPDDCFISSLGITTGADGRPIVDPNSYETNIAGIHVIGSLAGKNVNIITEIRIQTEKVIRYLRGLKS